MKYIRGKYIIIVNFYENNIRLALYFGTTPHVNNTNNTRIRKQKIGYSRDIWYTYFHFEVNVKCSSTRTNSQFLWASATQVTRYSLFTKLPYEDLPFILLLFTKLHLRLDQNDAFFNCSSLTAEEPKSSNSDILWIPFDKRLTPISLRWQSARPDYSYRIRRYLQLSKDGSQRVQVNASTESSCVKAMRFITNWTTIKQWVECL